MKRTLTILTMIVSMLAVSAMAQGVGDAARRAQAPETRLAPKAPADVTPEPTTAWPQEPTGFRGVPWGTLIDDAERTLEATVTDRPSGVSAIKAYDSAVTMTVMAGPIGDVYVSELWKFGEGSAKVLGPPADPKGLESVIWTFASDSFDTLSEILVARFGPATETRSDEVENRMGAKFTNSVWVWRGPNVTLSFIRYAGNVAEGIAVFELVSASKRRADEQAATAAAAKDSF